VLVGRVLGGWSHGNLPLQEQFLLGGPSTLRAFGYGQFRGNSEALVNVEYRVPLGIVLRQLKDMTGAVYVDAGAAPVVAGAGGVGYGVAVMVSTPVGPIRVDYAVNPQGGRQTWLTIGSPF
jgi:outer membrane protein insertion porin family